MARNKQFPVQIGGSSPDAREDKKLLSDLYNVEAADAEMDDVLVYDGDNWRPVNRDQVDNSGVQEYLYTNATPTPAAVGGVVKGRTFDRVDMRDLLDELLYPFVANVIRLDSQEPNFLREYGDNFSFNRLDVIITVEGSSLPDTYQFRKNSVPVQTGFAADYLDITSVADTTEYEVEMLDLAGQSYIDSVTYTFVYPYYYGIGAPALSAANVATLTKDIATQGNKTINFNPAGQVYYFAYPAAYGNLTRILDWNGFDITADFTVRTEDITGLDTSAQSYFIYEFNNVVTHADKPIIFEL